MSRQNNDAPRNHRHYPLVPLTASQRRILSSFRRDGPVDCDEAARRFGLVWGPDGERLFRRALEHHRERHTRWVERMGSDLDAYRAEEAEFVHQEVTRQPLAQRVRELRRQRGLTRQQLAELSGLHPETIARLEAGSRLMISPYTRERLEAALGESLEGGES